MGIRVVNGNTSTEDGWPLVDQASCRWITVPGTDVSLQIQDGQPAIILGAWAADWNAYIEPLRDPDSASWTESNDVLGRPGKNDGSNHLGGTAVDLNWSSHPFRQRGSLNGAQMQTLSEMEDFYEGTVFWAGRWDDPVDEMHSQMGYDTFSNPHTQDFINRKIRADGFSTFRRGTAPVPPVLTSHDRYALAIIEEGRRRNISPRGIMIALSVALVESSLTMYANSNVPESLNIPHEAVGSDHDSLGLFQQRCPMWGPAEVLMNPTLSAGLFYDRLAATDYNDESRSPGSFAADIQRPAAKYRGRYDERFGEAQDLYARLSGVAPPPIIIPPEEDDFMSALSPDEQRRLLERTDQVWGALFNPIPSKSRYGDPTIKWSSKDFWWNDDGFLYDFWIEHNAQLGDPEALWRVRNAAANGDPLAQAFLAKLDVSPEPGPPPTPTPTPAPTPSPTPQPTPQPAPAPIPYPNPSPPGQGSLASAIDTYAQQTAQASSDFAQRMQEFKNMLNSLIG